MDRRVEVEEGFLEGEGWGGKEEGFELGEEDVVFLSESRVDASRMSAPSVSKRGRDSTPTHL